MVKPLVLDVREDIQQGREPFARIMKAVESLRPGQQFVLINSFEPRPLYKVLSGRGFGYRVDAHGDGDWRITFYREDDPERT